MQWTEILTPLRIAFCAVTEIIELLYESYAKGKFLKHVIFHFMYFLIPPRGNIKVARCNTGDANWHAHLEANLYYSD
jgi:hypothetical protein